MIKSLRLALAAWVIAFAASAAVLPAPAGLANAVVATAQPGDTVQLGRGVHPVLQVISRKGLKIVSDPGATLAGFNVSNSTDIDLVVNVDDTPTTGATNATIVGRIGGSTNVRLHDCNLLGRPVPAGTPGAVLPANGYAYGLIVGFTQSRGLTIEKSNLVTVEGCEATGFAKSVVVLDSGKVTVRGNNLHDMRTTPITVGGATPDLVIDRNVIGASHPFRTPGDKDGDHLDAMHIFNVEAGMGAVPGLVVTGNVIDQGDGYARLGINVQGPYVGARYDGNVFIGGNNQGATIDGSPFIFTNNTMIAPVGSGPKAYPTLDIRSAARKDVTVTGNRMADLSAGVRLAVDYPDNKWLARAPSAAADVEILRKVGLARLAASLAPVDPRDVQIADLKAQASAASALRTSLAASETALAGVRADLAALTAKAATDAAQAAARAQMALDARDLAQARGATLQSVLSKIAADAQAAVQSLPSAPIEATK